MSEEKKRVNKAQRYTQGMLDAVEKLVELVRTRGLSVLPPRAVEVIGKSAPTRALLIEAAVRVLLDDANDRAMARDVAKPLGVEEMLPVEDRIGRPVRDPFRGMTVMYGGPPTLFDPMRPSFETEYTTTTADAIKLATENEKKDGEK